MVRGLIREVERPGTGKTQTRRILKPQPIMHADGSCTICGNLGPVDYLMREIYPQYMARFRKGDRLYVRETFSGNHDCVDIGSPPRSWDAGDPIWYWADGNPSEGDWTKPKPGIHMPRWASRLTLTVTDVRVQRLQEISEADVIAEGIERRSTECSDGVTRGLWYGVPECGTEHAVTSYGHLWDSINNPRALCPDDAPASWAANPWIVAVTFTVERRNIDAC